LGADSHTVFFQKYTQPKHGNAQQGGGKQHYAERAGAFHRLIVT
jgi:hypothetical protein